MPKRTILPQQLVLSSEILLSFYANPNASIAAVMGEEQAGSSRRMVVSSRLIQTEHLGVSLNSNQIRKEDLAEFVHVSVFTFGSASHSVIPTSHLVLAGLSLCSCSIVVSFLLASLWFLLGGYIVSTGSLIGSSGAYTVPYKFSDRFCAAFLVLLAESGQLFWTDWLGPKCVELFVRIRIVLLFVLAAVWSGPTAAPYTVSTAER
ncbi:hypothetical protein Tco_0703528 [Tanacetum coccineum]|uniref:Transmembrane protein n=1 Tax=Tanacetum coccineum TaxID=301880 RepID=A0ABQ4Y0H1_9ASTR